MPQIVKSESNEMPRAAVGPDAVISSRSSNQQHGSVKQETDAVPGSNPASVKEEDDHAVKQETPDETPSSTIKQEDVAAIPSQRVDADVASRKRPAENTDNCGPDRKRPKTEKEFHFQEMKRDLKQARDYARNGNRSSMDFCIQEATKHAHNCNAADLFFYNEISEIRGLLNDDSERNYFREEMTSDMKQARMYAIKGDRSLMDFCIEEATKHARNCNAADSSFYDEIAEIRGLQSADAQFAYCKREMTSNMKQARKYATKGDRSLMDFCIEEATKHARNGHVVDSSFHREISEIRNLLSDDLERIHFRAEMTSNLKQAREYAMNGDRSLMNFCIEEATRHACNGNAADSSFRQQISEIRNLLSDGRVKNEPL